MNNLFCVFGSRFRRTLRRGAHRSAGSAAVLIALAFSLPALPAENAPAAAAKPDAVYSPPPGFALAPQMRRLKGGVHALAYSPDGKRIAAGDADSVKLWDVATGVLLRVLDVGHTVDSLAFSPDGKAVVEGGVYVSEFADTPTGYAAVWDLASGDKRKDLALGDYGTAPVTSVAFTPDGKSIVVAATGSAARLFRAVDGVLIRSFGAGDASGAAITSHANAPISPDGKSVASQGGDEKVELRDLATGKLIRTLPIAAAETSLAISPDGKTLAMQSDRAVAELWSLVTGKRLLTFETGAPAKSADAVAAGQIAFAPDGRLAAAADGERGIRIWDAGSGKLIRRLATQDQAAVALALAPDGRTIAAGDSSGVSFFDAANGAVRSRIRGAAAIDAVAFAPDSQSFLAWSDGGTIHRWDAIKGSLIKAVHVDAGPTVSALFSQDGRTAANQTRENGAELWDTASGKKLGVYASANGAIDISPDGATLALAAPSKPDAPDAGSRIQLYEIAGGKAAESFAQVDDLFQALAFAPDGRSLASGAADGTVRRWDKATGKSVMSVKSGSEPDIYGVQRVAFTSDAATLLVVDDFHVELRAAADGRLIQTFKKDYEDHAAALSPDGRLVAIGGAALELWGADGKKVRDLTAPVEEIVSLAFARDGRSLLAGDASGALRWFDVAAGKLRATFYARGDDWAALAPDGRFAGAGALSQFVALTRGLDSAPMDDLIRINRREDLAGALSWPK
jgi:WD40 repeat protein